MPKSRFAPKQVRKAIERGAELVFVWGGDGMVQRCVDTLAGGETTLAIVPAGEARAAGEVTESWLERETLQVLVGAGLPAPVCQARIERKGSYVGRVDFLYAAARLVIEVSGYRWHRTVEQAAADAERRRRLTLAGFTVLEYTFHEVVSSPDLLVAEVAEALGRARAA